MKKILVLILLLYGVSFSVEQKNATFSYFGTFSAGYLNPVGDVKKLSGSASTLQLGLYSFLKDKFAVGGEFDIASLPANFEHIDLGYEQDRRWYNISVSGSYYFWKSKKPMDYRRHFYFKPSMGAYINLKAGYYYHALIFRILQIKQTFWDEGDINFVRHGIGYSIGCGFHKVFDIGFGIPIGINMRISHHTVSSKPSRDEYHYFDGDEFETRESLFPDTMTENYWQFNLALMIMNIKVIN